MKLSDLIEIYRKELQPLYASSAGKIITDVFDKITGMKGADFLTHGNMEMAEVHEARLKEILVRLKHQEPLQYILGEAWFMGLRFQVNKDVLIPRPETEELVEWIITEVKEPGSILDVCTGSGCIAVALKKHFPEAHVAASDVSAAALDLAGRNSILNNAGVAFLMDDILDPKAFGEDARFDVIVSNPPYIGRDERDTMAASVKDHEPEQALFVPGKDPLVFYRALAVFGKNHLSPGGTLYLEINQKYGGVVCDILENSGYKEVTQKKDLSGNDRMIKAVISKP